PPALLIDDFKHKGSNSLGSWRGTSGVLPTRYRYGYVELSPRDADAKYHLQFAEPACYDLSEYKGMYLHVVYQGTTDFTISLEQNNEQCSDTVNPYPQTWDSVEAGRYANENEIYVPLKHFEIDLTHASSVSFHGFYTKDRLRLLRVEIVKESPQGVEIPEKIPCAKVVLSCKRPNSFAFGIDDGEPWLAKEVMDILEQEDVKVTMEGLKSKEEIDNQIQSNADALKNVLDIKSHYFRPPYGTLGARTLTRLNALLGSPAYSVGWSVDIEDWLWAKKRPAKQWEAFKRDVDRGGNIVVMHYLHKSTVRYLREGIRLVKGMGLDIMRVDQCLGDPNAPEYVKGMGGNETVVGTMVDDLAEDGEGENVAVSDADDGEYITFINGTRIRGRVDD
ncbi:hypothetical protein KEM55_005808, partial [Ascosphaera atra]